jgi:acetyltransferase-like isoleucine patch superfamily enzyme
MDFAIMNTNASLDHDSLLGTFSHMAPGSHTGGRVTIGSQTFIGIGSSIRDGVKICDNCIIGMGSNVVSNVSANVTGWGNPFKVHA